MTNDTGFTHSSLYSGRISTVLHDWLKENLREERLSYVFLRDIYELFFENHEGMGLRKTDYDMPIFSRLFRIALREIGVLDKCVFKRRKTGVIVFGITIKNLSRTVAFGEHRPTTTVGQTEVR